MKKIGGWNKKVKIGCLAVAVAWSTFQMPVYTCLAAYDANNIEEMTAKDRTFELVPLPCIREAAETEEQTAATPSEAQRQDGTAETATPSEAQESSAVKENGPSVQESTTAEAEESAPVSEEAAEAEESAPVSEEAVEAEESAPVSEEAAEAEETAPVSEEAAEAEESAPVSEEAAEAEETAPVSEEAAEADQTTSDEITDNGFRYWAEDVEVEQGTENFDLYKGIAGNKKGYFVGEDMVEYSELLDTEVPGDYAIAYVIADPSGKVVETFTRTVMVKAAAEDVQTATDSEAAPIDQTATPSQAETHTSEITLEKAYVQQDGICDTEDREAEKIVKVQLRGEENSILTEVSGNQTSCYIDSNPGPSEGWYDQASAEYCVLPEGAAAVAVTYDEAAGVYEGISSRFTAELGADYYLHVITSDGTVDFPLDLCGPVLDEKNTKFYEEDGDQVYDIGLELKGETDNSIAWIGWSTAPVSEVESSLTADSAADEQSRAAVLNQAETYTETVKNETYQIRLSGEEIQERMTQGENCIYVYAGDNFGNVNEIPVAIRQQEQLSFTVTQSVGVEIQKTENGCQMKSGEITVTNHSEVPVNVLLTAVEQDADSTFHLTDSKEALGNSDVYLELVSNDDEQQRMCIVRNEYPVKLTDLQPEAFAAYHLDGACSRDIAENIGGSFEMKFRITPVTEQ